MKQYTIEQIQETINEILQEFTQDSAVEILQGGKPIAILVKPEIFQQLQQSARSTLWDTYQQFRQETDLAEFEDNQDIFANLRDPSLGRNIE